MSRALVSCKSVNTVSGEELEKVQNEMSEIQGELTRVKALNEKLKAKLRAHVKKEKARSESLGEYDSSEIKADFEKARQDKLNLEKSAYEMREELDEVVRRKDNAIADLKAKIQQLSDEKSRGAALLKSMKNLLQRETMKSTKLQKKPTSRFKTQRSLSTPLGRKRYSCKGH